VSIVRVNKSEEPERFNRLVELLMSGEQKDNYIITDASIEVIGDDIIGNFEIKKSDIQGYNNVS